MPVVQLLFARGDHVGEALVVAQVEVRLGAVVGDVDLAVLVRAHRAGIDVDVGVELLEGDLVAVPFEQAADRGGRQALAEGRDHAAGHEDVFHGSLSVCLCHVSRSGPGGGLDEPPHPFQILRSIHADGVCRRFGGADAIAVLERAQLLEAFGQLERRLAAAPRASAGTSRR